MHVPAVDYIHTLKTNQQELSRELDMLRHELDAVRAGGAGGAGGTGGAGGVGGAGSAGGAGSTGYGSGGVPSGSPFDHPPGLPPPPDSPSTT